MARKVVFDIVINTLNGALLCTYFKINIDKVSASLDVTKLKVTVQLVHGILNHMDEERTRLEAKGLG